MIKMLEAALTYAQMGLPVFPCDIEKEPMVPTGVHAATVNLARVHEWWTKWPDANIGCHLGAANLMAYDLDPGSDPDALYEAVGGTPAGFPVQNTPRGGTHHFFEVPEGIKIAPGVNKVSPHVDIRSHASYVLLWPSRTKDGEYSWVGDSMSRLTKCPMMTGEMVATAQLARERHPERDEWIIEPDLPENVEAASRWLATEARIATEHQDGDHTAYATAAMMRSFGLSEEKAVDLMVDYWDPRNNPPWYGEAEDFFRVKAESAYQRYATSPPGNMTKAYRQAKQKAQFRVRQLSTEGKGYETQVGRFRFADLDAIECIEPPSWLVPDLLPAEGYAILFGAFGTCKTFIAVDLACTIATLDTTETVWPATAHGPVLFVAGEGRSGIKNRVAAWAKHHGARPTELVLVDPVPGLMDTEEGLDAFVAHALERRPKGYKLIVLDTIGRAMAGGNENTQEDASKFTALVAKLTAGLGCAVLALHHSGHGATERARGSSVFTADADTVVRAEADGPVIELTMVKQKDAEQWRGGKLVRTEVVQLGGALSSLVIVSPQASDKVHTDAEVRTGTKKDDLVMHMLEALRSNPGKQWTLKELTTLMQANECPMKGATINGHIGTGKRAWALKYPALAPYYDNHAEKWTTPLELPPRLKLQTDSGGPGDVAQRLRR